MTIDSVIPSNSYLVSYRYDKNLDQPKRMTVPSQDKPTARCPIAYHKYKGENYPLLEGEKFDKPLSGGGSGAKVFLVKNPDGKTFVRKYDVHEEKAGHGIKALASEARTLSFLKDEGNDNQGRPIPFAFEDFKSQTLTPEAKILKDERHKIDTYGNYFPEVYQRGVILKPPEQSQSTTSAKLVGYILDQQYIEGHKILGEGLRDGSIDIDWAVKATTDMFDDLLQNGYSLNHKDIFDVSTAEELFDRQYTQRVKSRLTNEVKNNTDVIALNGSSTTTLKDLFSYEKININGKAYENPMHAMDKILKQDKPQVRSTGWSTHGDLNISNVMAKSGESLRLIDMRSFKSEMDSLQDIIKHQFGCPFTKIIDGEYSIKKMGENEFEYTPNNALGEKRIDTYKTQTRIELMKLPSFDNVKTAYPDVERRIKVGVAMQFLADLKFGMGSPRAVADFLEAAVLFDELK